MGAGQEEVCPVKGIGAAWRTTASAREAGVGGGRNPGMPGCPDPALPQVSHWKVVSRTGVLRQAFVKLDLAAVVERCFGK